MTKSTLFLPKVGPQLSYREWNETANEYNLLHEYFQRTKELVEREIQTDKESKMIWLQDFDERQQKEIKLCRLYAKEYAHGTDGHNAKLIIAHMAEKLDTMESERDYAIADVLRLEKEKAAKKDTP